MDLNEEINVALADIIQHHQMIIQVCHMLEDITSPFILVKSIEISFQICVLALTFMKVINFTIYQYYRNFIIFLNFRLADPRWKI